MRNLLFGLAFSLSLNLFAQTAITPTELPNVVTGQNEMIAPCSGCSGAVIIFWTSNCPYVKQYEDRAKQLVSKYNGKVSFYFVEANPGADESQFKEVANGWNASFLSDKKQTLMNALGARKSPEAFVLKPDGKNLKVIYQGAIDDNPQVASDADNKYLTDAIDALIAGSIPKTPTERAIGCTIRKGS